MLDTRAYEGWRRLTDSVCRQAGADDPAALAQLVAEHERLGRLIADAANRLHANGDARDEHGAPGYSWAELGAELGISRQAAHKRFARPAPDA